MAGTAELGTAFSHLAVPIAAEDRDLVAFYELRMLGYTTTVGLKRAELLEEYPLSQLTSELRRSYQLSESDTVLAIGMCVDRIRERRDNAGLE